MAILRAKKDSWNKLCAEVDADLWGTGYKIVTGKVGLQSPLILTDEEQMKIAKTLFPEHKEKKWPVTEVEEKDIPLCTRNEIVEAGKRMKTRKAAGPDGIPPEVIKAIAEQKPELLEEATNNLLKSGNIPREWKMGKLTLIEKPSKAGEEKTYRPLCLLNTLGKFFEQIINRRLIEEIEERGGFAPTQFGFRKGLSTTHAIQTVQNIVEEATREMNMYVVMVTLDVKNAFNSAPWEGIIGEIRKGEIAPYLRRLICSYLENRTILVGESGKMRMTCGVPQGSVLGPTLWNIYYDEVLREELPDGTTTIGYADDLALVVRGKTREELEEKIEWSMARIETWMLKKGLQLAPHKTEVVVLAGRRTIRTVTIRSGNTEIVSQRYLKYLGVQFGHNMSMGEHIQYVAKKAEKAVAALGRLMPNIGGPREGRRRILSSVVNSIILYAAPAWKDWVEQAKYRRVIERVQRKIAIRIASAYRTTSTKAIQVIAGTIPIHLLVKERTYEQEENRKAQKERARENTMRKWQEEWEIETTTAQWTKKLIPEINHWMTRKHGEVGYYLTQFLSGHGRYKSYLHRMKIANNEECIYCRERDTPEHTVLKCRRWNDIRERVSNEVGEELTAENIVRHMLESERKWMAIEHAITDIMKGKEKDERGR